MSLKKIENNWGRIKFYIIPDGVASLSLFLFFGVVAFFGLDSFFGVFTGVTSFGSRSGRPQGVLENWT